MIAPNCVSDSFDAEYSQSTSALSSLNLWVIERLTQRLRNKIRRVFEIYGTPKVKQWLWDAQFSQGRWDCLDTTPGDCVYSRIEKSANGGSILDLGCGSGSTANELDASTYQDYTGVDISKVAIGKAQRMTEENSRGHKSRFYQSDLATFVPTKQFDVILFRDSIYYIEPKRIKAILERYSKWLKEDGVFIVRMWDGRGKFRGIVDIIDSSFDIVEEYWPEEAATVVLVFRRHVSLSADDPSITVL
jgi:SAM-dependent methyltransferase